MSQPLPAQPFYSVLYSSLPLFSPSSHLETPGDEAALLPYSIMNEGSFQPTHSSLLQQETLSCQPHSLHTPAFLTLFAYMCVRHINREYIAKWVLLDCVMFLR